MTLPPLPDDLVVLGPEAAAARAAGRPIVALESTIITHGMPWPDNLAMAKGVEEIIRARGAAPATVALMDGMVRVGLDEAALTRLARTPDAMKLSRADLAFALAARRTGATTVAATMICAHLAGVRVFATGGVGGVHRGAAESFDVSADLTELSRTPVTVVCAGAKAILDLPKTLEALETLGVPVVGYRTDELPAFWSRTSGLPVPIRLDGADQIAAMVRLRERLALGGGVLVVNPIPPEAEIPAAEMAVHVEAALRDAAKAGVSAKQVTPFLLKRVLELTEGRSLAANIALVRSNAALAAEIAVALGA